MAYPPFLVVFLTGSYLGLLPPGPSIQVLKSISMTMKKDIRRFFFCLELFCAIFFGKYFKLATPSRIRDRSKLQFMALFDHAHYKVSWLEKLFTYL